MSGTIRHKPANIRPFLIAVARPSQTYLRLSFVLVPVTLLAAILWLALTPAISAPNDTVADRVGGQPNFTSGVATVGCNHGGISASSLCTPDGVFDGAGNLYIADQVNNRVLEYNDPLATY